MKKEHIKLGWLFEFIFRYPIWFKRIESICHVLFGKHCKKYNLELLSL